MYVNILIVLLYGRGIEFFYLDCYVIGYVYWFRECVFLGNNRVRIVLVDLLLFFDLFSWGVNR